MARLSTKKFQDLDVSLPGHVLRVEVFYRKRGNTIGEFFFESFTTEHPIYGPILIPGAAFDSLQELNIYVEARVANQAPVPSSLTFTKYARKQPISEDQLERCVLHFTLDGTPLYRSCIFVAKDNQGKIWYKLSQLDEPKLLDSTKYEKQMEEFTVWDEHKQEELNDLLKCAAKELATLKEDWLNKYKPLVRQKHDECTGVRSPQPSVEATGDPTLKAILEAYS